MPACKTPLSVFLFVLCGLATLQAMAADESQQIAPRPYGEVVLVHSPPEIMTVQKLPNFVGVSGRTVGAKQLSMNLVVIPPGARAEPHHHQDFESAVYVLEGRVETRWGPGLEHSVITEAGDFLFIPPDVPHQPINLSDVQAARAIVVRNDPHEQEHVVTYDPAVDEGPQ
ncbi:MAG: cupin domain-containing protein [Chromatiales bacterium]|jgi:uncharacterized RmlC-like cupin family protein